MSPEESLPPSHENADSQSAAIEAASDPALSEPAAEALLKNISLPSAAIEKIAKNPRLAKSRKVRLALVEHPRTPRHISISALRDLFTFDLMRVALQPTVAADIKIAADETLVHRLETISSGEKLSLARRGSNRIASELLLDSEPRVVRIALENSRLTEALLIKTLMRFESSASLAEIVRKHAKWSARPEVQNALARQRERDAAKQPSRENEPNP